MNLLGQAWVFWIVAGVVAACGLVLVYRGLWRDRARGVARCAGCWYDLRAVVPAKENEDSGSLPVTCPECGRAMTKRRQLYRTRRHYRVAVLGLLIIGLSLYSYEVRHRLLHYGESLKTAVIPSTAYIVCLPWTQSQATFDLIEGRFANRMLPNRGDPQGGGFWLWQERLYQTRLSSLVESGEPSLRVDALHMLLRMAQEDDHALRLFASHLDHVDPAIRQQAMSWAGSLGERMVLWRDAVFARLEDDDAIVVQETGFVIFMMGPEQFGGLTDERLCQVAGLMLDAQMEGIPIDWILTTIVRSGLAGDSPPSAVIMQWLRKQVASPPKSRWASEVPANLELVTALRRLEGREGPLTIDVEPVELRGKVDQLPMVKAVIRNIDPDGIGIGFQQHGDNRGRRPMRWRIEARSVDGELMPIEYESLNFGGISSYTTLERGDMFEITLEMKEYMKELPAGEYRVVVIYHDSQQISQLMDVSRLIVTRSNEIRMVIEP